MNRDALVPPLTGVGIGSFSVIWVRELFETVFGMAGPDAALLPLLIGTVTLVLIAVGLQWDRIQLLISLGTLLLGGVLGFLAAFSGLPGYLWGYGMAASSLLLAAIIHQWDPNRKFQTIGIAATGTVIGCLCWFLL